MTTNFGNFHHFSTTNVDFLEKQCYDYFCVPILRWM
jgi:hypothetical protein